MLCHRFFEQITHLTVPLCQVNDSMNNVADLTEVILSIAIKILFPTSPDPYIIATLLCCAIIMDHSQAGNTCHAQRHCLIFHALGKGKVPVIWHECCCVEGTHQLSTLLP